MPNVIIIHGTGSDPNSNWFPWLKRELEKAGHHVHTPVLPTPEGQNLNNWLEAFKPYEQYLNNDAIVVGHSVGPAFLLSIIERLVKPIKAAFFVSGFTGLLNNPVFDPLIQTISDREFDWDKIKANCNSFHTYFSDNDPYVPFEQGKQLANDLSADFTVLHEAGHINQGSGYTKFQTLLDDIIN